MAADAGRLRYLASKGHFGHAALLDPDTFVASAAPSLGPPEGELVAQNATNELGFSDKLKIDIPKESGIAAGATRNTIRTKAQADLNERLMQQGVSLDEISRREQGD